MSGAAARLPLMSILSELSERVPGRAFGPGSTEYDEGRTVFYGPGAPEVVFRPTTAEEVAAAVRAAVDANLSIAVRSGGHGSMPATGGAVIDLAEFSDVELLDGDLVRVGSGAHWGDVAAAIAPHGLAITSGDTLDVGVGGLALGGGIGWLVRTHGLTIDLVREIEFVTAAGAVLTVTADSHPDLFWALRGGGGNFGIATRFVLQASPVGELVGGHLHFDQSQVGDVLRAWRDVTIASPDELNSTLIVMPAIMPEFPAGPQLAVALRGTEEELRGLLEPLLALPSITDVSLGPVAYAELLEEAPPGRPPFQFVGGNGFVADLSDELLAAAERAYGGPAPTMVMLRALGGAYARVAPDATAVAYRDAQAFFMVNSLLPLDAPEADVAAVRLVVDEPLSYTAGHYSNFTQEFGDDVTATIYPPETLARLKQVKADVDPGDVFRPAHHITPA